MDSGIWNLAIQVVPKMSLFSIVTPGEFSSILSGNRFWIGHNTNTLFTEYSFFYGRIKAVESTTVITGSFGLPIELYLPVYIFFFIVGILLAGTAGIVLGLFGCCIMHFFGWVTILWNHQSREEILDFIMLNLHGREHHFDS